MTKQNRFKSLSWNGPQFPEPYKSRGLTLQGKRLPIDQEEVFFKLCGYRTTDYWKSPIFQKNAVKSVNSLLKLNLKSLTEIEADIQRVVKLREGEKATKAAMTKEEKDEAKFLRDEKKEKFGYATVDGERVPIGGYLIEDANFIIGRGDAVFTGCYKMPVKPQDVTVNIVGDPAKTRELTQKGFKVESNPDVIWLYKYKMNLCGFPNYQPVKKVNFATATEFIHENEENKYDKTMDLVGAWKKMSDTIKSRLSDDDPKTKQAAGIAYLMMKTGIRVGGEGAKNEAGTVGASTLQCQHLKLVGNTLKTNFKGKDSVVDQRDIELDSWAVPAFSEFLSGKGKNEKVFDLVSGQEAARLIKSVVPNASPKVFRTANACVVLVEELRNNPVDPSWNDVKKKAVLVRANLAEAKQLNHQKNVSKSYGDQESKAKERVQAAVDREKERQEKAKEQITALKKQVEAAKATWKGEKLKEKLADLKEKSDKIKSAVERAAEAVEKAKIALNTKQETKNVALGTSLGAYCSPKLVYSWCKDVGLPAEKVYTKSLMAKQRWAESTPADYWKTIKVPNTKLVESLTNKDGE